MHRAAERTSSGCEGGAIGNMKTQTVSFEENKDRLDGQYLKPQWHSGLPAEQVAIEIRRIYSRGELAGAPYQVTKAKMLQYALENIQVAYDSADSFAVVCERTNEITAIANERNAILSEKALGPEEWQRKCEEKACGFYNSTVDMSHTSPDWDAILTLGVPGLIQRAEERCKANPLPFYQAVIITFNALKTFLTRLADAATAAGRNDVSEMILFLTEHAPETLQQALQISWAYREMQEMEGELVRSMGIFDRQFLRFYEHDIAAGILARQTAEDLLCIFFSHCHAQSRGRFVGVHFCFGGLLPDGQTDGCNELTTLSLNAFRRLGMVDPKFSIRVNDNTPQDVLELAFNCIREGKNSILFCNEDIVRKSMVRNGKDEADLPNFIPVGCYEPAIMGKELCCSMTGTINMAKGIERLMDPSFEPKDFNDVLERYLDILKTALKTMMVRINILERQWSLINPATTISGTMEECMDRGRDATDAGTKYRSSGIMCAGIGTVADSLAAVDYLVFQKKMVTFQELCNILKDNWDGHESLRMEAFKRAPKWGINDAQADAIAQTVTNMAADVIEKHPNGKGGHFQMGLWSIDWCLSYGRQTAATPDGRHAGDTLSKNTGSTIGCDTDGASGLVRSAVSLDYSRFADGSVLDMMLTASNARGDAGLQFMMNLFKVFRQSGGAFMHFNVLSVDELKAAQKEPEKYGNLQIRLCGWSVRFVDLGKDMQDCLIREAESKSV